MPTGFPDLVALKHMVLIFKQLTEEREVISLEMFFETGGFKRTPV